jgi:tetratricopeptide (TPR) repeat protein
VATTSSRLAIVLTHGRQTERALQMCEAAFERIEHAFGAQHPELMASARACGALERRLGHRERARDLYERAHSIAVETYGPRHEEVARALDGLAALRLDAGAPAEAERLLRDALAITQTKHDALTGIVLRSLARSLREQGRVEEAREEITRAIAVLRSSVGDDDPDLALALAELRALDETPSG